MQSAGTVVEAGEAGVWWSGGRDRMRGLVNACETWGGKEWLAVMGRDGGNRPNVWWSWSGAGGRVGSYLMAGL